MPAMSKYIYVATCARGGSTWTARVLSAADDVGFLGEVGTPHRHPDDVPRTTAWYGASMIKQCFMWNIMLPYLAAWWQKQIVQFAEELQAYYFGDDRPERYLIKWPVPEQYMLFLPLFDITHTVVVKRHPMAIYNSMRNIDLDGGVWLSVFIPRDLHRWWYFSPQIYSNQLTRCRTDIERVIGLTALQHQLLDQIPEPKIVMSYEEMCLDPYTKFKEIYDFCEIPWDPDRLGQYFHPDEPETAAFGSKKISADRAYAWKKELPPEELENGYAFMKKWNIHYASNDSDT